MSCQLESYQTRKAKLKQNIQKRSRSLIPFVKWMHDYSRIDAIADIITGITIGIITIPQSVAYVAMIGLSAKVKKKYNFFRETCESAPRKCQNELRNLEKILYDTETNRAGHSFDPSSIFAIPHRFHRRGASSQNACKNNERHAENCILIEINCRIETPGGDNFQLFCFKRLGNYRFNNDILRRELFSDS